MSTDSIEKLYKNFGILADAKDKISEHEEEYKEIREAVKGSAKEKRLASQFIARFFKHFPHLADKSIEALLDLCEDEDVSIRKQAIKDLPTLCKDNVEHTPKIADILAQLLMTEDTSELAVVHNSFMTLFKMDPKGTLCGVFSQILTGEEPTRVRCLKFLNTKVKALGRTVIVKEAEDYIITECKRVIQDANADEFYLVMELLGWSRLSQSVTGQKEMIEIVATKMELDQEEFDPVDEDQVDRLIHCVRHALPYFSSQVESGQFVSYMCRSVLSCLSRVKPLEDSPDPQLDILKLFAELCTHCSKLPDPDVNVEKVLQRLTEFMPLPPISDDDAAPSLEFSYVECLIYSFHRLARQAPEVLLKDVDRLKDFRLRLQYFARGIQGYIKKLREALKGKSGDELKTDENKMKVIALKTTSNINTLIKDLFHSPPSYKSNISLSWRPITLSKASSSDGSESGATKRHAQITFDAVSSGAKQSRTSSTENRSNRELYQPPSGKYSNKVSSYLPRGGRGGGGIGRGRMRGSSFRGSGRGWRRPIF